MSKLREDLRVGVLGATSGFLAVSAFLLIARIDDYYDWLSYEGEFHGRIQPLWWIPVLLVQVFLSLVSALAVHRYLGNRIRSTFLLWQAIGFGSLLGWVVSVAVILGLECVSRGSEIALDDSYRLLNPSVAKYFVMVFATYVFYGSLVQSAVRQYGEQPPIYADEYGSDQRSSA